VVAIVMTALLACMILPALTRDKQRSQRERCIDNLKRQGLAFRIFANNNDERFPFHLSITNGGTEELVAPGATFLQFRALSNEFGSPSVLTCPADTRRPVTNWSSFTESSLSYFVGLDTEETTPMTLLSGDRNLTLNGVAVPPGLLEVTTNSLLGWTPAMHRRAGNVCFGDGSVSSTTSLMLTDQVRQQETATNRLLVP
jgi:prepilin-type processing-associated H-X9-DG protein